MPVFHKISAKQLVEARNNVFLEWGMPALQRQHFDPTPFAGACFGRDDDGGYTYEWCRLGPASMLETVRVEIVRGDRWVKVFINLFLLHPSAERLDVLTQTDGLPCRLPPLSRSEMRLRIDDVKTIPLFNLWGPQHKVGACFSQRGFDNQCAALGKLLHRDLSNINTFFVRWRKLHRPARVNWKQASSLL
jgi:hypothetical protein